MIMGMLLCVLCFTGCSAKEMKDQVRNFTDAGNKRVEGVKNGYYEGLEEITYGDAFKEFFSHRTWKSIDGDDGEEMVEFTGHCLYQDQDVNVRLQFILSDDGERFVPGDLYIDEKLQNGSQTDALLYKVFTTYAEKYDIDLEDTDILQDTGKDTATDPTPEPTTDSSDTGDYSTNAYDYYDMDDYDDSDYDDSDYEDEDDYDDSDYDDTEYVFPNSDTRKLTKADVRGLSAEELRIGRNEIYARHGRKFNDQQLQDYFDAQSWYYGYIEPDDFIDSQELSKLERRNANFIRKFE